MKPKKLCCVANIVRPLLGAGAALVCVCLLPQLCKAGLPQPMCVYYGQARDTYGLPYKTNVEVILRHGTNDVARQVIKGSITPGVNFALYVHIDEGKTATPYSPRALRTGDLVSIVVHDEAGEKTIMEAQAVPPVAQPGELVAIRATAGTDADADGLPDQWENELVAWSGGTLRTIYDVNGRDDWDADGMTNLEEYHAGTFAFLDYDYLAIDGFQMTPNQRLRLVFLSVPGMVYTIKSAATPNALIWDLAPLSLSDTGVPTLDPVEGTGDWLSVYLPLSEPGRYYRVQVW